LGVLYTPSAKYCEIKITNGDSNGKNKRQKETIKCIHLTLMVQILTPCAHAAIKMPAGAHTLIDIPPVYLLAGERKALIKRLV
jgi:diaminopimelate dehydrogenase